MMRRWVFAGICLALLAAGLVYMGRGAEWRELLPKGEQRILADPKAPPEADLRRQEGGDSIDKPPARATAKPCDPNDPMCGDP